MKNTAKLTALLLAAAMIPAVPVFAVSETEDLPYIDADIEAPVGVFEDITDCEEFFVESEYGEPVTALLSKVDFVAGDANLDGVVNNVDIAYTQRYLASWSGYNKNEVALGALDLDGDGAVNAIDVITLNRHFASWDGYESIRANSFSSEQNTTTFVISATPMQYRARSYDGQVYNSASDTGVTYVGIQKLHGGLPSGTILYVPCEDLGIPEEDVEEYFNRSVDVVNYHERSRTFTDATLGEEPVVVTHEDVTYTSNKNKLIIGDVKYTVGNFIEGTELLNEMVIYYGNSYVESARMLSVDEDGYVIYGGNVVADFEYESSSGVKYYTDYSTNRVLDEFTMLVRYGVDVTGKDAPFTCINTMEASELNNEAFTLELYDDDHDGLYERAVYAPIYMGVYYTYPSTVSGAEKQVDGLLSELGYVRTAEYVSYSDPAAQETGAISTFTYNAQTNRVDVIDVLEVQTGVLEKVSAIGFNTLAASTANTVKLTIDGEQYTVAYDMPYSSSDISAWSVDGAQLGASVLEYELVGYDLADLGEKAFLDIANSKEELGEIINTARIGGKLMYVAYNGYILMLSEVNEVVYDGGWTLITLPSSYTAELVDAADIGLEGEGYADTYHAYYGDFVDLDTGLPVKVVYSENQLVKTGSSFRLVEVDANGVCLETDGTTYSWNDTTVASYLSGDRNYALYGISDVNTSGASNAASSIWGVTDGRVNYFDWLYCHKTNIDVDGYERVPKTIQGVELVDDIIEIESVGDCYVVTDLETDTVICNEADDITCIKVFDISSLATEITGDEAIEFLSTAPQIVYIGDTAYLEDGILVFITATMVSDK